MKNIISAAQAHLLSRSEESSYLPIASSTLFVSCMYTIRMACQATVLIIVARLLGAEGYGIFAGVVALATVFAPFSGLGGDFLALRSVAQIPNMESRAFRNGLILIIVSAVPMIGFVTLLALWWFSESIPLALIIAVLLADLLHLRCTELVANIYQGRERFSRMGVVMLLTPLSRLFAVGIILALSIDVTPTLWAQFYLGGSVVAALLSSMWLLIDYGRVRSGPNLTLDQILEGLHFAGGTVSARFHTQADKSLVLILSGAVGAGVYTAAYRIVELTMLPVIAFTSVVFARLLHHKRYRGRSYVARLTGKVFWPCLLFGLITATALWLTLASIMEGVLGHSFSTVRDGLVPLALLPIPMAFRLVGEQSVAAAGLLQKRSRIQWTVAAIALTAYAIFIPAHGWIAAAWICLGIETLLSTVYIFTMSKLWTEPVRPSSE